MALVAEKYKQHDTGIPERDHWLHHSMMKRGETSSKFPLSETVTLGDTSLALGKLPSGLWRRWLTASWKVPPLRVQPPWHIHTTNKFPTQELLEDIHNHIHITGTCTLVFQIPSLLFCYFFPCILGLEDPTQIPTLIKKDEFPGIFIKASTGMSSFSKLPPAPTLVGSSRKAEEYKGREYWNVWKLALLGSTQDAGCQPSGRGEEEEAERDCEMEVGGSGVQGYPRLYWNLTHKNTNQ